MNSAELHRLAAIVALLWAVLLPPSLRAQELLQVESRGEQAAEHVPQGSASEVSIPSQVTAEGPRASSPGDDPRDLRARKAFGRGEYREALELYIELFAAYPEETTYYRNVGRCYQNLGDAERAIASFRNYLQRAQGLSAEEKMEIEGYIHELSQSSRGSQQTKRRRVALLTTAGVLLVATPVLAGLSIRSGLQVREHEADLASLCSVEMPCATDSSERMRLVESGRGSERAEWRYLGVASVTLAAGVLVWLLAPKSAGEVRRDKRQTQLSRSRVQMRSGGFAW